MGLKSYMSAVLIGTVLRALLQIVIVFVLLVAAGEILIHWPEIRAWFQSSARARELSQPLETVEKRAKL